MHYKTLNEIKKSELDIQKSKLEIKSQELRQETERLRHLASIQERDNRAQNRSENNLIGENVKSELQTAENRRTNKNPRIRDGCSSKDSR